MANASRRFGRALTGAAIAAGMVVASLAVAAPARAASYQYIFTIAKNQIGTLEGTAAADKYFSESGLGNRKTSSTPWCAAFVTWVSVKTKASTIKSASVNDWVSKSTKTSAPRAGDLVAFKWDGDSTWDHIGIVTSVGDGYFYTIEGNTSNPDGGKDGVFAKRRTTSEGKARAYLKLAD